jgi:short-subunit dehydrogenase
MPSNQADFLYLNIMENYSLVTGASSGIGLEICNYLASKKHNLILTARNEQKLKDLSSELRDSFKIKCDYISCDLSMIESPKEIYDYCKSKKYNVNVLVNNAGFALPNSFEKTPMEDEERFLRVLSTSVISLTKIFINDMILKKEGKIMIVSSVAAYAPPSKIQVLYGPVKTFMNRFSEALNLSYNNIGVTCTALCPGYTVTNFHTASGVQDEMDRVPKFLKKSAKRIAVEGVDGMLKGKKIVVPTKTWKVIVFLLKIVPKSVFDFLSSIMAPGRYDD